MYSEHVLKKLKGSRGETITEVLVSTLIAALAMILFASMVIASKNIIKKSCDSISDYYRWTSKMVSKDGVRSGTGTVSFDKDLVYETDSYGVTVYHNESSGDDGENDGMSLIRYE